MASKNSSKSTKMARRLRQMRHFGTLPFVDKPVAECGIQLKVPYRPL
jgi:hypothetical protein